MNIRDFLMDRVMSAIAPWDAEKQKLLAGHGTVVPSTRMGGRETLNVLILAETSAEGTSGGAERTLREQALALQKRGHTVRLLVRSPEDDSAPEISIRGITEKRYPVDRRSSVHFALSSFRNSMRLFLDHCHDSAPDAVIIHQSLAGLGPIIRARSLVRKWVYMFLSPSHEEYLTRIIQESDTTPALLHRLNASMRRLVERIVIKRCHDIVAMSDFMKERIMRYHGVSADRIHTIPGAVDPSFFSPCLNQSATRAGLNLPQNRTILFTVRNLEPRMGLENLVTAVSKLDRSLLDNLLLIIGGSGPLRARLEQLVHALNLDEHVTLTGFIAEDKLPFYYQAADLMVVPTLMLEGFGLVLVEAMACGTPVMGTPVGAIPEILRGIDPLLIAEGTDEDAIAAGISRIVTRLGNDPAWRRKIVDKGLEAVRTQYNWDACSITLEDILKS
jgi:glycosyltransferase involved in cell wall biosynthesis